MKNDLFLYIDTSDHLIVGLYDLAAKNWCEFIETKETRTSGIIHKIIHDLLEKFKTELKELKGVVSCAGPGSYTGMRVSEGIVQMLAWQKIPIYSFYHFEVPSLIGIDTGVWFASAFKGEAFLYKWSLSMSDQKLVCYKDLEEKLPALNVFTHFLTEGTHFKKCQVEQTGEIVKAHFDNILAKVLSLKMRRGPFYYRSLNQEFSRGKK